MHKTFASFLSIFLLAPLVVHAMSVADYNACVQEAVEAGIFDTTHCTQFLTDGDDGSDEPGQQSSSSATSEQTFSTQQESSSSVVSSEGDQQTSSSDSSASITQSTTSASQQSSSATSEDDDEDDDEESNANSYENTGVQSTGGTYNSPCPDRSRGTTAEEKNGNPNFVCKCLEGYIPDPSKRTCIQDFYGVTSKKSSSSTSSYIVARNLDYVSLPEDVPTNAWYAKALKILIYEGYIDEEIPYRPAEEATRGEFIMLLVRSMVTENSVSSASVPTFDDLPEEFIPHFELAASKGWIQGEGNCIGTHPCYIKPDAPLNRAAAAVLMNRAFSLTAARNAPVFMDVSEDDWFADGVRTTASRCILRGDEGSGYVRPSASLNRAEMAVMLERIEEGKTYPYCN